MTCPGQQPLNRTHSDTDEVIISHVSSYDFYGIQFGVSVDKHERRGQAALVRILVLLLTS